MKKITILLLLAFFIFSLNAVDSLPSGEFINFTEDQLTQQRQVLNLTFTYKKPSSVGFSYEYNSNNPFGNIEIINSPVSFQRKSDIYQTENFYAFWHIYTLDKVQVNLTISNLNAYDNDSNSKYEDNYIIITLPGLGLVSNGNNNITLFDDGDATPDSPRSGAREIYFIINPELQIKDTNGDFIILQNAIYKGDIKLEVKTK